MQLKIQKVHPDAILPRYQSAGAACFDIHAVVTEGEPVAVHTSVPRVFRTGLKVEIPEGWAMMIYSRSGTGFKNDTRLANVVGVIDSDYRGEVMVKLTRDSSPAETLIVRNGDRIAQAMLIRAEQVAIVETDNLSDTERGENGLGSTGVSHATPVQPA